MGFLNSLFEGPNDTIPDLHFNQTYNLTLNFNFVVKNNKTEKKQCYSIPSVEILLILRYQSITTKIKQYLPQTWLPPNTGLRRWSHKGGNHKNWLHFCHAVSLSSYYGDQWLARKFNTVAIWAVVTTSSPSFTFLFQAIDVMWSDFFLQCTQKAFLCLVICMWLGFICSLILSWAAWTCKYM